MLNHGIIRDWIGRPGVQKRFESLTHYHGARGEHHCSSSSSSSTHIRSRRSHNCFYSIFHIQDRSDLFLPNLTYQYLRSDWTRAIVQETLIRTVRPIRERIQTMSDTNNDNAYKMAMDDAIANDHHHDDHDELQNMNEEELMTMMSGEGAAFLNQAEPGAEVGDGEEGGETQQGDAKLTKEGQVIFNQVAGQLNTMQNETMDMYAQMKVFLTEFLLETEAVQKDFEEVFTAVGEEEKRLEELAPQVESATFAVSNDRGQGVGGDHNY